MRNMVAMNSGQPLTLFTASRASTITWSAEAKAFFAGMERIERGFPSSKPPRFTDADLRAAVAREDARPSPYPIGSALHAADWQHNVKVAAGWEAWSRKVEANIIERKAA